MEQKFRSEALRREEKHGDKIKVFNCVNVKKRIRAKSALQAQFHKVGARWNSPVSALLLCLKLVVSLSVYVRSPKSIYNFFFFLIKAVVAPKTCAQMQSNT